MQDTIQTQNIAPAPLVEREEHEVEACTTCLMVVANGDTGGDDDWDSAAFEAATDGYHVTPGSDDDSWFSHSDCQLCGGLAGTRHTLTLTEV